MATKKSEIPEPVFLSAPKAASLCGVSRNTICCWIRDEKLPSYRTAGGKYLIRPADLMGFMRNNSMFVPPALVEIAAEDEKNVGAPPKDQEAQARQTENEPTILVVDDDEAMRRMVTLTLKSLDLAVLEAQNGFEALHLFTVTPTIGLVILDMIMPGQGGADTFEQIRKLSPTVPVVVLTGQSPEYAEEAFAESRPDMILYKPVQSDHLRSVASTFLSDLGF